MYREAIQNNSNISGSIKCGACGTIYSANEVAGVKKKVSYFPGWFPIFSEIIGTLFSDLKLIGTGFFLYAGIFVGTFVGLLVLIWWFPVRGVVG